MGWHRAWRYGLSLLVIVVLCVSVLTPSVSWPMIGWLRGEAFYRGKPTSYWALEVQRSYVDLYDGGYFTLGQPQPPAPPVAQQVGWIYRQPTTWAHWLPDWLRGGSGPSAEAMLTELPLVDGDDHALPVLIELLRNDDPKVRQLAAWGLGILGKRARVAMPDLVKHLQDENPKVVAAVAESLKKIKADMLASGLNE
jgi:hypothetical protein